MLPHLREAAAALLDVALQPAHQPDIGVRVDEQLEIHLPAEALVGEHQYPLDDHHGRGFDPPRVGAAHVLAKVILRDLDGLSGAQGREVSDEHLRLDGVRMVVVDA